MKTCLQTATTVAHMYTRMIGALFVKHHGKHLRKSTGNQIPLGGVKQYKDTNDVDYHYIHCNKDTTLVCTQWFLLSKQRRKIFKNQGTKRFRSTNKETGFVLVQKGLEDIV